MTRAARTLNTACTALAFVLVGARWHTAFAAESVREWLLDREVTRWANETGDES